jgi:hypothetical protein
MFAGNCRMTTQGESIPLWLCLAGFLLCRIDQDFDGKAECRITHDVEACSWWTAFHKAFATVSSLAAAISALIGADKPRTASRTMRGHSVDPAED